MKTWKTWFEVSRFRCTIFLEKEINFQALAANGFSSTLAKNAGTSVDQLERFYLKNMASTKELIENLQTRGDD